MKLFSILFYLILPFFLIAQKPSPGGYQPDRTLDKKIDSIINDMTLKEKVGQMAQIDISTFIEREKNDGEFYGPFREPNRLSKDSIQKYIVEYGIGSIFNVGQHGYTPQEMYLFVKQLQTATTSTKHKIPIFYGIDAVHGNAMIYGATIFPHQLGMASTWNPDLTRKEAEITAYEMRAANVHLNFGPGLDVGKSLIWSRLDETFGEDVYLTRIMSQSIIKGMEGSDNDISDKTKVSTTLKHFLGYGYTNSGKDRTPSWIPENTLREYFIPPFSDGISNGAHTVMISSNEINGEPLHASQYWIQKVLREELNFKGVVVSDWRDIEKLYYVHHIASSYKEAIAIAINAGIDINMVPYNQVFMDLLIQLVQEGRIKESRINQSVHRIIKLKYQMGLFDVPFRNPKDYKDFGSQEFSKTALKCAQESMILLKNNESILPLKRNSKILVVGPTANSMNALNGGWTYSWQGYNSDIIAQNENTIYDAVRKKNGSENTFYIQGSDFEKTTNIDSAIAQAQSVDYIILCLGEDAYAETPGFVDDITLSEAQLSLAQALNKTGKPIVLLLSEGRPRLFNNIEPFAKAIILSFLPGNQGGNAFSDVLFGDYNPSGKLPITYPRYPNNLINYDHKFSDQVDHSYNYNDGYNPQYPFGYGLSYSKFFYSNLTLSKDTCQLNDTIHISVKIKNTSPIDGTEIVQLYSRDVYAKVSPPVQRLRAFKKIFIKSQEEKQIFFTIPISELKYVGFDNTWTTEEGDFIFSVSNLQKKLFLKIPSR